MGSIRVLEGGHLVERKILRAKPAGPQGSDQEGIDLYAEMDHGARWVFQCKHVAASNWSPGQTTEAFDLMEKKRPDAERYFLLLTPEARLSWRKPLDGHPAWELWDGEEISGRLFQCPRHKQVELVTSCFSKGWAERFFPLAGDSLLSSEEFFRGKLNDERLFHHCHELVGRKLELAEIWKFLRSKNTALVVSARAGDGKSRLLKAVADIVGDEFPELQLRFASRIDTDAARHELRHESMNQWVIVQDDAHREELIDQDLFKLLGTPAPDLNGETAVQPKVLFFTRPQAIDATKTFLRDCGFSSVGSLALSQWTDDDLNRLAEQSLAKENIGSVARLARWSDGSPLICTVGAGLLNQNKIDLRHIAIEEEFRNEVLDRFGRGNLESLVESGDTEALERLLAACAMLSPLKKGAQTIVRLSQVLEIKGLEAESQLRRLQRTELIEETGEGLRVSPDVYSDHLVFKHAISGSGERSVLCDRICNEFGTDHLPAILRNLADAEWRARATGKDIVDLTDPLWQRFRESFVAGSFSERLELINQWWKIAPFLPEKTVDLCRIVIRTTEAPPELQKGDDIWDFLSRPEPPSHHDLCRAVEGVLPDAALRCPKLTAEVLDLLWELNATESMGRLAKFSAHGNYDVVRRLIEWLDSKLTTSESWFVEAGDGPVSEPFREVLGPVFDLGARVFFSGDGSGEQQAFDNVEEATQLASSAIEMVRRRMLPLGDLARISAVRLLADQLHRRHSTGPLEKSVPSMTESERISILEVLGELTEAIESDVAAWHAFEQLRTTRREDDRLEVTSRIDKMLSKLLRDTDSFEFARAYYSSEYDEVGARYLDLQRDNRAHRDFTKARRGGALPVVEELRAAIIARVSAEGSDLSKFLGFFEARAEELSRFSSGGINFYQFAYLVAARYPEMARELIEQVLDGRNTLFASAITQLTLCTDDLVEKAGWNARALSLDDLEVVRNVSFVCSHVAEGAGFEPKLEEALINLARSDDPERVRIACRFVAEVDRTLPHLQASIGEALRLDLLDSKSKLHFAKELDYWSENEGEYSPQLLNNLLDALVDVENLTNAAQSIGDRFIHSMEENLPDKLVKFLRKRVEYKESLDGDAARYYRSIPSNLRTEGILCSPLSEEQRSDAENARRERLARGANDGWEWGEFFILAYGATSEAREILASEISGTTDKASFEDLIDDITSLELHNLLGHIGVLEDLLVKSKNFGADCYGTCFDQLRRFLRRPPARDTTSIPALKKAIAKARTDSLVYRLLEAALRA